MLKYFVLLFVVVGLALFYVFIKDPCNQQVKTDFLAKYPSYEILDSSPAEGSPESVRCHISYRKPDSEEIFEAIWLYMHTKRGWEFSKTLEVVKTGEAP
jgi:hypothetical protein